MAAPERFSVYGSCKCCLKTTYLKNMWKPYDYNGEWEVYGQMLVDCFGIDWTIIAVEDDNICQVCISKLRVSIGFRKQVLESKATSLEVVEAVSSIGTIEEIVTASNDVKSNITNDLEDNVKTSTPTSSKPLKDNFITVPLKQVTAVKVPVEKERISPQKMNNDMIPLKKYNLLEKIESPNTDKIVSPVKLKTSIEPEDKNHVKMITYEDSSDNESETSDDARNFKIEFLEEDTLEEYGDDEDMEPQKKKRNVPRNLLERNNRTKYKNYLEEDLKKAIEAVKSGKMTKRTAAQEFNVPRETIAIKINSDKHEAERIDSEPPHLPDLQNDENSETLKHQLQNNANCTEISKTDKQKNYQDEKSVKTECEINNETKTEKDESEQENIKLQIPEADLHNDLSLGSKCDLQDKSPVSEQLFHENDNLSEIILHYQEEIVNLPQNTEENAPTNIPEENISEEMLKFSQQPDLVLDIEPHIANNHISEITRSNEEINLLTETHHEIYVEESQTEMPQQLTIHFPEVDLQNNVSSDMQEDLQNYVIMEVEESDIQENLTTDQEIFLSTEAVLEMHKANIHSIIMASNATPIKGNWGAGFACYYCSQLFAEPSDLKLHTFEHQNLLIKVKSITDHAVKLDVTGLQCNICKNPIGSLEELMEHLRDVHNLAVYMEIPNHILPFSFDSGLLTCVKCSQEFETLKDLSDHMSDAHYRNYVCVHCDRGFVNVRSLKTHSILHGVTIFICSHCPAYFGSKEEAIDHENSFHSDEINSSRQTLEPKQSSVEEKKQRKRAQTAKADSNEDSRQKHSRQSSVYKSTNQIKTNNKVNRDTADICLDVRPLDINIPDIPIDVNSKYARDEDNEILNKICNFPKAVGKEWNIAVYDDTNPQHKCRDCSKMFKSVAALNFHANLTHRKYKCDICTSVFDLKFDLQRHKRREHPSRTYDCLKCTEKFTSRNALEKHAVKHKSTEHSCELCCSKFSDENSYMLHMKNDHGLE